MIGVAHAAFIPERRETVTRLVDELKFPVTVCDSLKREHASVWARRLWEWAAQVQAENDCHVVCLNDDVKPHPDFVNVARAMVTAVPDKVISLHTSVPEAPALAKKGAHWLSCYWLTGPGYILPPGTARSLLNWMDAAPREFLEAVNEDVMGIQWAWSNQQPIWGCIPALVQHDVSVASTLGYDDHPMRQSCVPWDDEMFAEQDMTDPTFWTPKGYKGGTDGKWIENPWMKISDLQKTQALFVESKSGPANKLCSWCMENISPLYSPKSGVKICPACSGEISLRYLKMMKVSEK
jgi:hypothetical protein